MPVILKIIWLERSDNRSTRFAFDKNWVLVQMFCSDLAPGKARDRHDWISHCNNRTTNITPLHTQTFTQIQRLLGFAVGRAGYGGCE